MPVTSKSLKSQQFRRAARLAFNDVRGNTDEVIDFLCALRGTRWLINVGRQNARDYSLLRVTSYKAAIAASHSASMFKVWNVLWTPIYRSIKSERFDDELHYIGMTSIKLFGRDQNLWNTPAAKMPQRVAYAMLMHHIEFTSRAIWLNEPNLRCFHENVFGYFTEGHWPCGWRGKYPSGKLVVY